MADETSELLVSIKADLSDLKSKFDEAAGATKKLSDESSDGLKDFQKMIGEAFSAEKIKEFFEEGIKDFAEFDKQLTLADFNLQRFGQSTADTKEQMESWADEIQATTLFTKTEAITTLNKLVTMTHDLGDALKLSKLAMDVSSATGLDLTQVTVALGNAFEGNTAGLGRFTRQMPELKQVLLDGGDAVAYLQERFSGMSEKIGQAGLAGQIFHLKTAWQEVSEEFAKSNQGAISDAIDGFQKLSQWVSTLLGWFMKLGQTIGVVVGAGAGEAMGFLDILKGHFREGLGEIKAALDGQTDEFKKIWADATDSADKSVKKFHKNLTEGSLHSKEQIGKDSEKIVESSADMLAKITAKQTMTLKQAYAEFQEGEVHLRKAINETDAAFEKRVKDMEAQHNSAAEVIKKTTEDLSKAIVKTSEEASNGMAKAYKDGTLTTMKAFELLGQSIFKNIVAAIASGLEASGTKDMLEGAADLLNPVLAAAAPGFFLSGGAKLVGAGTIRGIAEVALAEGGYVNAPTLALIGEKGPEKVVPLSQGHSMDKGKGDTHVYNMNFPNVRNAKDFTSRDVSTISRKLFTQQQDLKTRSGNRNTSF
jgi:hypothetical protein